jgi:hypothetical protein
MKLIKAAFSLCTLLEETIMEIRVPVGMRKHRIHPLFWTIVFGRHRRFWLNLLAFRVCTQRGFACSCRALWIGEQSPPGWHGEAWRAGNLFARVMK